MGSITVRHHDREQPPAGVSQPGRALQHQERRSWIGLGDATVEVAATSFRYDLPSLTAALTKHHERIGAVVA